MRLCGRPPKGSHRRSMPSARPPSPFEYFRKPDMPCSGELFFWGPISLRVQIGLSFRTLEWIPGNAVRQQITTINMSCFPVLLSILATWTEAASNSSCVCSNECHVYIMVLGRIQCNPDFDITIITHHHHVQLPAVVCTPEPIRA